MPLAKTAVLENDIKPAVSNEAGRHGDGQGNDGEFETVGRLEVCDSPGWCYRQEACTLDSSRPVDRDLLATLGWTRKRKWNIREDAPQNTTLLNPTKPEEGK